jgi:hypothetical protein
VTKKSRKGIGGWPKGRKRPAKTKIRMAEAWLERPWKQKTSRVISVRFEPEKLKQILEASRAARMNVSAYVKSIFEQGFVK